MHELGVDHPEVANVAKRDLRASQSYRGTFKGRMLGYLLGVVWVYLGLPIFWETTLGVLPTTGVPFQCKLKLCSLYMTTYLHSYIHFLMLCLLGCISGISLVGSYVHALSWDLCDTKLKNHTRTKRWGARPQNPEPYAIPIYPYIPYILL